MLLKLPLSCKAGFTFVFILFFHTTAWGFDERELLKVDIRPYLSVSYGAALVDGCEDLATSGRRCQDVVTGETGSFAGAAGIRMNDYLGLEIGYLPGFSAPDVSDSNEEIKIEGGYIAPRFSFPLSETTQIFAKPGAFWGKLTERGGNNGVFDEEGISLFLDAGVDHRVTKNFSLQLGVNWLPDVANTKISNSIEPFSDASGETAEIDVFRFYFGVSLALF